MSRYTVLIDGKKGAYGVVFPDIDGCVAMGKTIDEALANGGDVLRDIAADMDERAEPLPKPRVPEELLRDPEVAEALTEGSVLASVPLVRETGRPTKANLSLDAGILAAIDEEASRRKLTRSAFIELLARHALGTVG